MCFLFAYNLASVSFSFWGQNENCKSFYYYSPIKIFKCRPLNMSMRVVLIPWLTFPAWDSGCLLLQQLQLLTNPSSASSFWHRCIFSMTRLTSSSLWRGHFGGPKTDAISSLFSWISSLPSQTPDCSIYFMSIFSPKGLFFCLQNLTPPA